MRIGLHEKAMTAPGMLPRGCLLAGVIQTLRRSAEGLTLDSKPTCTAIRGTDMECPSIGRFYSGLMLAARITLAHFSMSSAMSFAKSAYEPRSTVPPTS